jgi:proteasome lid subunit RPN8/RPN11
MGFKRKRARAIRRATLRMILEASKDTYPNEFAAVLRAEEGVVTEIMPLPGTKFGERSALLMLHMLPVDFSVVGSVHSHPSGVCLPSDQDLQLFNYFGYLHIIVGWPYGETSWQAWDHQGRPFPLEVVD